MRTSALVFAFAMSCASAQQHAYVDQSFEREMPWEEIQAALPDFPADEDMLQIRGNFGSREYWVDGKSLKVDPDGVVRLTMIIKAEGVKNIIYEGVRCETKEHKVYSVGRNNGTWGKVQGQKWQRITNRGIHGYHDMLYKDFFCPGNHIVASRDEALNALKRGMHPGAEPRR